MSLSYVHLKGTLRCESGVRVGGSRDELEIGGVDNPVLREAESREPYLPGSSIKGRMRSLLERDLNMSLKGKNNDQPHGCDKTDCYFCKVFGPHNTPNHQHGPSRLIVRDAYLSDRSREDAKSGKEIVDLRTENVIDRQSNTAKHPRPVERVVRGTTFDFALAIRLFEGDDEAQIKELVRRGLELLQQDGIGGGITRGHGQISITFTENNEWLS